MIEIRRDSCIIREIKKRKYSSRQRDIIRCGAGRVVLLIVGIVGVMILNFGLVIVKGNDMYPALRDGDIAIYYRGSDIMNEDAVVYDVDGEPMISRVQATYGAVIDTTRDNRITIDGNIECVDIRTGIMTDTKAKEDSNVQYPYVVNSEEYYVLGDNRKDAVDSRIHGAIPKDRIRGKVFIVVRRRGV